MSPNSKGSPFPNQIVTATGRDDPLEELFARNSLDLLDELRTAWGIPSEAPICVVGCMRIVKRAEGRDLWFLEGLEDPRSGLGLLYPTLPSRMNNGASVSSTAFIPPGPSRRLLDKQTAASVGQWAIAELELSRVSERRKYKNPWLLNVRSGTLRLLSELPDQWHVLVTGNEYARRIATLARDEIEAHVRDLVLKEDQELSLHHSKNAEALAWLEESRRQAEEEARETYSMIDASLNAHLQRCEDAKHAADDLLHQLESEQKRLSVNITSIKNEIQQMETQHRELAKLLSTKGDRLIALGLADAADVAELMPQMADRGDKRPGVSFEDALFSNFANLAPLLQSRLADGGLLYSQAQLRDFLALLRTRDLIVLAGDSGSGKTSLVRAAAAALGGVCNIISVKPNWTGPEDLLGYFNPIERSYQATPFLLALQAAARNPLVPHFICLDEMNLARIEHYFADFLSLLEDRSSSPIIHLYTADEERHVVVEQGLFLEVEAEARRRAGLSETATIEDILRDDLANTELHRLGGLANNETVLLHHARLRRSLAAQMRMPTSLTLPPNIWFLGAVNMDDTTHHFSPKVLDRVHVLRFDNPMLNDWDSIEREIQRSAGMFALNMSPLRITPEELGVRADYPAFDRHDANVRFLSKLSRDYLDPLGVEFGMRAVRQALAYIAAAEVAGLEPDVALDNVIKHKILPKIAFDAGRSGSSGRPRREILLELRAELERRFKTAQIETTSNSAEALDRMIRLAEGNNNVVSYWLR